MTDTAPLPSADSIDRHVGARVRQLRKNQNLTQEDLGERVGVSYQQIQKYEIGTNRISASRMFLIAKVLGIGPADLFDGLGTQPATELQ